MSGYGFVEPVSVPAGFAVDATFNASSIDLAWPAVANADGYTVYCGLSADTMYPVMDGIQAQAFTVTGLRTGSHYFLQVTATLSPRGSVASALVRGTPSVPAVTITWDPALAGGGWTLSNGNLTGTFI